ncbi:isocitrate lyase/phosphoenolpyruvate mutase family protein [Pseudohalocynthiibacter sp. F2068]|jgi:2-methylisocitrate lyase-like PEP mutase family enzyme|uniref:isocitrate lyase/PEP mutase family protein n=1 Tax=Pseudohalocynthiibacter sp. F2068 TaxID=2926418 RepID=UPI001FF6AB64|nr:isocitrate lyase/phosphoenolpyruvate mutase family protein [Pseudohalocynthiibacter sp. F2068]MCK0100705.1 isocitrate lyase/phosphoenolpyruvate mutase family protein [Pseudohalocynthiibacter sp. F2068]
MTGSLADRRKAFRARMDRRDAMILPGAGNALTARVIADRGFDAVYVTGAGIANTYLGAPDIGLVTLTELVGTVSAIAEITDLPLIVDIDTGFGNAINTQRTVRMIERAGAAAMQMEDQVFPKKCGHFAGKAVIPLEEAVSKVKAAVDAREDANTLIIARTDARAIHGLEAALDRAEAFIEAGADMTFVEAPTSVEEMQAITARLSVPQVANMVVGGKTPLTAQADLVRLRFSMVLYANTPLQAAMRAMSDVLGALKADGDVSGVIDKLADFEERQRLVDKDGYDALEARYKLD